MIRSKAFKAAFVLLILVGVLNWIAIKLYLYWTVHYFDSLVHFLAGMCVGLASLWLASGKGKLSGWQIIAAAIIGALVIGLLWEIYELAVGDTTVADGMRYVTDTSSDILMDVLGGLAAGLYIRRTSNTPLS